MWTRMLLISIADNLGDLDATRTRLLENPKDIAKVQGKEFTLKVGAIGNNLKYQW